MPIIRRRSCLGVASLVLLAIAACRTGDLNESADAVETTTDVIAINVLIEPDATLARVARQANQRLRASHPEGFALDATHTPHISLLHRYVRTRDLTTIYAAVDRIVANLQPRNWRLTATGYETAPWERDVIVSIVVQRSPELAHLQAALVSAFAPYMVERGDEQAFVTTADSMHIDPMTIEYVAMFVPRKVGTNFHPHITVGLGDKSGAELLRTESFRPIAFHSAAVAVYQLGNVGTARKKLHKAPDK